MDDTDEVSGPVLKGIIERGPGGRFVKGNPGPPAHAKRKKGQLNKIPRTIKESMTGAAARYGRDGKGTDGMDGFWDGVAKRNPEFLAAAITKTCVPPAKEAELDPAACGGINVINIISIPHDHSICPDGCTRPNFEAKPLWDAHHARLAAEEAPLLQIEHSALIAQEEVQVEPEPQLQSIEPAPQIEIIEPPQPAPTPALGGAYGQMMHEIQRRRDAVEAETSRTALEFSHPRRRP